jgi:hypothetical protein
VAVAAHAAMIGAMRWVLVTYQPEPNGFRLDDLAEVASFAAYTGLPVLLILAARSRLVTTAMGVVHALSPLVLIPTARNPNEDLNFAMLLWLLPVPIVLGLLLMLGEWRRSGR